MSAHCGPSRAPSGAERRAGGARVSPPTSSPASRDRESPPGGQADGGRTLNPTEGAGPGAGPAPPSLAGGLPFRLLGDWPEGQLLPAYWVGACAPGGQVGPHRRPRGAWPQEYQGAEGHTLTETHERGGEHFARLHCGVKLLWLAQDLTERRVGPWEEGASFRRH